MGKKDKKEKKQKNKQNPFDSGGKKRKGRGKGKTKQSKDWDKYFKEFNDSLQPKGIFMRDVEGDGNCLFRSVADFIDGEENEHEKYRRMAVEYINRNKEYFALFLPDDEDIDEYIKDMRDDGTWGGHFELVALSSLLEVKFCLHMKDLPPVIVKSSEKNLKGMKIVHLAYHIDEHYSSVRRIGDDTKEPAEQIRIEVSDDEDDDDDSSSEGSTGGSDREISSISKKVEKLYVNDRKNKKKGKNGYEEEHKSAKDDDYKGKGKNKNKEKEKEKDKKEDKGKGKKKGR